MAGGLLLVWELSISRLLGPAEPGRDLCRSGTKQMPTTTGPYYHVNGLGSWPPEDVGRVGLLSFTFSLFLSSLLHKENSSASHFIRTIAETGSFKCFKKRPENSPASPLSLPGLPGLPFYHPSSLPRDQREGQEEGPQLLTVPSILILEKGKGLGSP